MGALLSGCHLEHSTPDTAQAQLIYTTHLDGCTREGAHYNADLESIHGPSHLHLTHRHHHMIQKKMHGCS